MLELRHVSKTFYSGTGDARRALNDLSLSVPDGDFIAIIGANGAGKSTLFNAVCGDFLTDSGTIELDGRDITLLPSHRRAKMIGRLFQDPMRGSAPGMSIEENLLSGGQRQALTLMMATFHPPKLLLLDEHTAALDPGTAEKVLSLTKQIVAENRLTCLMITHNMQSALELGTRTIMMDAGTIIFDVAGEKRRGLTVADLLAQFKKNSGKNLDNDRMLLT